MIRAPRSSRTPHSSRSILPTHPPRRSPRLLGAAALALLLALGAAAGPAGAVPGPAPAVENLEAALDAKVGIFAEGDLAAFGLPEAADGIDRTGDGDTNDVVLQAYDGATRSIQYPSPQIGIVSDVGMTMCMLGGTIAFPAVEDGHQDLNRDGDAEDIVLGLWEVATGFVRYGPHAIHVDMACGGGRVLYRVNEAADGRDFNGDKDLADLVWHLYRLSNDDTQNLETSSPSPIARVGRTSDFGVVYEASEGMDSRDHNGDGDQSDRVIAQHRYFDNFTVNTRLAGTLHYDQRYDSSKAYSRFVPFRVDEAAQGQDLNFDGDMIDQVPYAIDARFGGRRRGPAGDIIRSASRWLTLVVDEAAEGGTDWNQDGDALDHVLVFQNFFGGARRFTNHALQPGATTVGGYGENDWGVGFHGRVVVATVLEADSGVDLNGDGDQGDSVLVRYDPVANTTFVIGALSIPDCYASERVLPVNASHAVACRDEQQQPRTSLSLDGDRIDRVPQIVDLVTGTVLNSEIAMDLGDPVRLTSRSAFVIVDEWAHGGDTSNQPDDDEEDDVLFRVDLATGAWASTLLAIDVRDDEATDPSALWAHNAYGLFFGVPEAEQGADLNRDGDQDDIVLHLVDG